ncbi:MAG: hypothetical protein ACLRT5_14595 [Lachnospiraceae bacterium]
MAYEDGGKWSVDFEAEYRNWPFRLKRAWSEVIHAAVSSGIFVVIWILRDFALLPERRSCSGIPMKANSGVTMEDIYT